MTLRRTSAWSAAALTAVLAAAGIAVAAPSHATAGEFGQHVRTCAQGMGFDGTHNPGMHRGASQWHHADHADHAHHPC